MSSLKRYSLISLVLTISLALAADAAVREAADPRALAVLSDTVAAGGGAAALQNANDTRITGTFSVPQPDGSVAQYPAVIQTHGSSQLRVESRGPGGYRTYISNGEAGWVIGPGGKTALTREEAGNRLIEINPVIGLSRAFSNGQVASRHRGTTTHEGIEFEVLEVVLRDSELSPVKVDRTYEVWINTDTRLIGTIAFDAVTPKGSDPGSRETYVYSDYRPAAGLMIPFRVEHYLNGQLINWFAVDSFETGRHSDSLFREP